MGGCQNYGPFLGTLNNRCRIIIGTQKGTIILTTTHMRVPQRKSVGSAVNTLGLKVQALARFLSNPLIIRAPLFLPFGFCFIRGSNPKAKGHSSGT